MKKAFALFLTLLLLVQSSAAYADGLFGSLDEVFTLLPSLTYVTGNDPDDTGTAADGGIVMTYRDVNAKQFNAFSDYLSRRGCTLVSSDTNGLVFHAVMELDGEQFGFSYDKSAKTAVLTYPEGSNVEDYSGDYAEARALYDAGRYEEAYLMFRTLGGFRGVDDWLRTDEQMHDAALKYAAYYDSFSPASIVTLGSYEQDNDLANGREPIEWIVIQREADRALLLCRKIIDVYPFDESGTSTPTWETSSLRAWLNGAFMQDAFTESERGTILLSSVDVRTRHRWMDGPNGQVWGSYEDDTQGNNTQDYVFAPASEVYHGFFDSGSPDTFEATPYAAAQAEGNNGGLITGGYLCFATSTVAPPRPGGGVGVVEIAIGQQNFLGSEVTAKTGVRPMLWLDLSEEGAHWY